MCFMFFHYSKSAARRLLFVVVSARIFRLSSIHQSKKARSIAVSLIEPLLALQEIDNKIQELKRAAAVLPRHKAAREADLSDALRRQLEAEAAPEDASNGGARDRVAAEVEDIRAEIAEIGERLAAVQAELAGIEARRAERAAAVPPEHLRFYERLAISHHPTIVKLEGNVCSGCHLTQPPSAAHIIKHDTEFVTCGMCGRILY